MRGGSKEVYLPPDTVEIGKYAFYGCVNLTTLGFSDSLLRTGAGIFTGCKLQKIYYDVYEDKKSALRDVVRDTRFPLQVNIRYKEEEKQSRLFYPEYYEEAVENTPARIVETHFHGTGYQYRQSFCEERSTIVNMMIFFQWQQFRKIWILYGRY